MARLFKLLVCGSLTVVLACAASRESKPKLVVLPPISPVSDAAADEESDAEEVEQRAEDEAPMAPTKVEPVKASTADLLAAAPAEVREAFERGVELMQNDPDGALAAFRAATEDNPALFPAHHNAAVLLEGQGKILEARRAYQRALAGRPDYTPAIIGLASLEERRGKGKRALELLRRRVDAAPTDTTLRLALAETLARHEQLDDAREEAIRVLRVEERSAAAMVVMGSVYRRKGMLELSELALGQALDIDPGLGVALSELGLVLLAQDKKNQAVQAFEKAAASSPDVAAIHNNLGALRNEVGAHQGARDALEKAVALEGARPEYFLNLGNALRGEQRYPEAEAAYRKALEVGAGSVDALFNLGVLYLDNEIAGKDEIQRYRECIEFLQGYSKKAKPDKEELGRIDEYLETAKGAIEREEKRLERAKRRAERESKEKEAAAADQEVEPKIAEPEPADSKPEATEPDGAEESSEKPPKKADAEASEPPAVESGAKDTPESESAPKAPKDDTESNDTAANEPGPESQK